MIHPVGRRAGVDEHTIGVSNKGRSPRKADTGHLLEWSVSEQIDQLPGTGLVTRQAPESGWTIRFGKWRNWLNPPN
jgi:hypothetical protein